MGYAFLITGPPTARWTIWSISLPSLYVSKHPCDWSQSSLHNRWPEYWFCAALAPEPPHQCLFHGVFQRVCPWYLKPQLQCALHRTADVHPINGSPCARSRPHAPARWFTPDDPWLFCWLVDFQASASSVSLVLANTKGRPPSGKTSLWSSGAITADIPSRRCALEPQPKHINYSCNQSESACHGLRLTDKSEPE
jgi:hypothetical protein